MLRLRSLAVMLVLAGLANVALADCGSCPAGQCEGACTVTAAMEKLPKMTYKVGEESSCCMYSAKSLADKSGEPLHFVVSDKAYDSEGDAMVALADVTEQFVKDFVEPKSCAVSGTTTVAGQKLHCSETAGKMAAIMGEAIKTVQMTYKVGVEECHCPNEAKSLAEKSGEKTLFVVGSDSTCCPIDARVKMAQAKYRAAVEALAKMQAEQKSAAEATSET